MCRYSGRYVAPLEERRLLAGRGFDGAPLRARHGGAQLGELRAHLGEFAREPGQLRVDLVVKQRRYGHA